MEGNVNWQIFLLLLVVVASLVGQVSGRSRFARMVEEDIHVTQAACHQALCHCGYYHKIEIIIMEDGCNSCRCVPNPTTKLPCPPVLCSCGPNHKIEDYVKENGCNACRCLPNTTWTPETDACIINRNDLILDDISLDDCKTHCQAQIEFVCRSVEYHSNNSRCSLSATTSRSISYIQPCYVMGWIFTEVIGPCPEKLCICDPNQNIDLIVSKDGCNECRCVSKSSWTHEINACISGNNNLVLDDLSLGDCKARCQAQTEFVCRSVEYNSSNGVCSLSSATSNSSSFVQPCHAVGWTFSEVV